jgi:ubiquinone biosynthesis protein
MTGQIAPRLQEHLLQLLLSVSEGRSDDAATIAIKIGEVTEQFQEIAFRNRIADLLSPV